jgi:hypothetical protein
MQTPVAQAGPAAAGLFRRLAVGLPVIRALKRFSDVPAVAMPRRNHSMPRRGASCVPSESEITLVTVLAIVVCGLKAQRMTAQGNALGYSRHNQPSPERAAHFARNHWSLPPKTCHFQPFFAIFSNGFHCPATAYN